MKSPVLFLIFNRPDTTERVFEEIRKARPPRLYVAADGPRASRPGEKEICEKTREIVDNVDWPCEVKTLFRDVNLGCGHAVSQAITWFFDNEPEGIIIEDDILPHPDFFTYCDELLGRYRDDERIQLVTGHNAFYKGFVSEYSYHMSSFFHIWGWASWRRVWRTYEFDAAKLSREIFMEKVATRLPEKSHAYWARIFDMMASHNCDTWDYQLYFNQLLNDRYSIIPFRNLTHNIGFGEGATHTTGESTPEATHKAVSILPLHHPDNLYTDPRAEIFLMNGMGLYDLTSLQRILHLPIRVIRKLKNIL